MSDEMVTIPELRVPRDELAAWQQRYEALRDSYEWHAGRSGPLDRVHGRWHLHLLDVDTSPPIQVGDVVKHEWVHGPAVVLGVNEGHLWVQPTSSRTPLTWRVDDCTLVTEEMGG